MRQYQPIWQQLKVKGDITVVCNKDNTARIKKAVIKEKDMDEDERWRHKRLNIEIRQTSEGFSRVHFRLVNKIRSLANI